MKYQNRSKLRDKFEVGDKVKDKSGLIGIITKVTARSITVKHDFSTGKYINVQEDTLIKL